jgi:hypothetical protein
MIVTMNEKPGFSAKLICLTKPVNHHADGHLTPNGSLAMVAKPQGS